MNIKEEHLNVARNMRIIETMKNSLLSNVAGLYEDMMQQVNTGSKVDVCERFSDIVLTSYLLGKQLGVGYNVLDKRIESKLRLCLLEEETESFFNNGLIELSEHFKNRRRE